MTEIAALGIAAAILAVQFRRDKPEYGLYLTLAATLMIFSYALAKLSGVLDGIRQMERYFDLNPEYLKIMMKILGITYLAEFSSDICKDAGQNTIGEQIQIFARLCILSLSMPIVLGLLETIRTLLTGT